MVLRRPYLLKVTYWLLNKLVLVSYWLIQLVLSLSLSLSESKLEVLVRPSSWWIHFNHFALVIFKVTTVLDLRTRIHKFLFRNSHTVLIIRTLPRITGLPWLWLSIILQDNLLSMVFLLLVLLLIALSHRILWTLTSSTINLNLLKLLS